MITKIYAIIILFLLTLNPVLANLSIKGSETVLSSDNTTSIGTKNISGSYNTQDGKVKITKQDNVHSATIIKTVTTTVQGRMLSSTLGKIIGCGTSFNCYFTRNGSYIFAYSLNVNPATYQILPIKVAIYSTKTLGIIYTFTVNRSADGGGYSGVSAINVIPINSTKILFNIQYIKRYRTPRGGANYLIDNDVVSARGSGFYTGDRSFANPLIRGLNPVGIGNGYSYLQKAVKITNVWGRFIRTSGIGPGLVINTRNGNIYPSTIVLRHNVRADPWTKRYRRIGASVAYNFYDPNTMSIPVAILAPYSQTQAVTKLFSINYDRTQIGYGNTLFSGFSSLSYKTGKRYSCASPFNARAYTSSPIIQHTGYITAGNCGASLSSGIIKTMPSGITILGSAGLYRSMATTAAGDFGIFNTDTLNFTILFNATNYNAQHGLIFAGKSSIQGYMYMYLTHGYGYNPWRGTWDVSYRTGYLVAYNRNTGVVTQYYAHSPWFSRPWNSPTTGNRIDMINPQLKTVYVNYMRRNRGNSYDGKTITLTNY